MTELIASRVIQNPTVSVKHSLSLEKAEQPPTFELD